ncbi:hypothetical protein P3T36_005156 [Kitasatospora sp. MAP12-15]|uniref:hypothetical protein n=1 Tax=unclassified Kitasatospora TaxID=2633591 RepID=UPI00247470D3|nr:hypothetical protein [Kitasatospora sp. MAP12-44]MDH6109986.1 hypothetical protein [Kitasatospora sp. MAP12-44]
MSYPPPAATSYLRPPVKAPGSAALPGLAVLMILTLVLELAVLAYDMEQKGAAYLGTAFGFSYTTFVNAPVGFFAGDLSTCVALLVMVIAGFTGRSWIRAGGTVLLTVNAYGTIQVLAAQLAGPNPDPSAGLTKPLSNLLLNADEIAQMLIAVVFAIIVLATRTPRPAPQIPPAPPAQPYYAYQPSSPYSPPPLPQQAPAYGTPPAPAYGTPPAAVDAPPVPPAPPTV